MADTRMKHTRIWTLSIALGAAAACQLACAHQSSPSDPDSAQAADPPAGEFHCEHQFGMPVPLPRIEGSIRIATYNIENFFDPADDPSLQGEFDDAGMVTTAARCQAIADAIRMMNADVIGLQEVESLEALTWFRDTYLSDMGYDFMESIDVGYYRGIENAVLSRFPITSATVLQDRNLDDVPRVGPGWSEVPEDKREGLLFQRSPLHVEIQVNPSYAFEMIVLHHKSGSRNRYHREAEALKVVEYVEGLISEDASRNIVVLGDFNAAPWDKSLRLYLEHGMIDTLAHRIIPRWEDAEQDEAKLTKTHQSDRVIDYVLLNSAMHREFVVGSAHVYGTPSPSEGWNWREDPHPPGYSSDHFPVIVDVMPADKK